MTDRKRRTVYDSTDAHCFCCERKMDSAGKDASSWEMPYDGVILCGGDSYGSALYDSLIDGISVWLIICDECLKAKRGLLREITR